MIEDRIENITTTQRHTGQITGPNAIWRMLNELAECKELLFFNQVGANLAFFAKVIAVDARHGNFQIALTTAKECHTSIGEGNAFDVFAPLRNADLLFKTSLVYTGPEQIHTYKFSLPTTLRLWHRREYPRGQCFGLVEVIMRRKDMPQKKAIKATLCDISQNGLGISLPEEMSQSVRAGDVLGDCLLLLNGKPIAACAIEVLYSRQGPKIGSLVAGARFVNLDEVTKQRIAKLITAFEPVAGELTQGTVDWA